MSVKKNGSHYPSIQLVKGRNTLTRTVCQSTHFQQSLGHHSMGWMFNIPSPFIGNRPPNYVPCHQEAFYQYMAEASRFKQNNCLPILKSQMDRIYVWECFFHQGPSVKLEVHSLPAERDIHRILPPSSWFFVCFVQCHQIWDSFTGISAVLFTCWWAVEQVCHKDLQQRRGCINEIDASSCCVSLVL